MRSYDIDWSRIAPGVTANPTGEDTLIVATWLAHHIAQPDVAAPEHIKALALAFLRGWDDHCDNRKAA